MKQFNICTEISVKDFKEFRASLGMTQREFRMASRTSNSRNER